MILDDTTRTVIAHRGGAALGVENAPETMALAASAGAEAAEIDVHQCADGTLVTVHDGAVVVDGERHWLSDLGVDDVRDRWSVAGQVVSLASDVLAACAAAGLGVYLDIKQLQPGGVGDLSALVGTVGLSDVVYGSGRSDIVAAAAAAGLPASWLTWDRRADPVAVGRRTGAAAIHPCFDTDPAQLGPWWPGWIERVVSARFAIVGWTVHSRAEADGLWEIGAAAVCADDPAAVR